MDAWKSEFLQLVNSLLWKPETILEYYALMGLGMLVFLAVLAKVSSAMDAKMSGAPRAFLAGILGLVLLLGSMTAASMYIVPQLSASAARFVLPAMAAVILLAVVMPLSCAIFKFSYVSSLMTWVVTLGAAMAFIYIGSIVFDTAMKTKANAGKAEERKESLQGFIDLHE